MKEVARGTCRRCGAMWSKYDNGRWMVLDSRQSPGPCCSRDPNFPATLMMWIGKLPEKPAEEPTDPSYFDYYC